MTNPTHAGDGAAIAQRPRATLRDPAVWAWLLVALLAIFPVKAALSHDAGDAAAAETHHSAG